MNEKRRLKLVTCLTDSAISGPIPSPGKRVALIGVVEEENALETEMSAPEVEFEVPRTWLDRLPISRLARNAVMVIALRLKRTRNGRQRRRLFAALDQKSYIYTYSSERREHFL